MIAFIIFLYGLIIGSFLNALVWRLHSGESMVDRSRCPKCHEVIKWYDNIPLFSFLFLRGKCRMCGQSISWQYPAVELVTAALFVLAFMKNSAGIMLFEAKSMVQLVRECAIIAVMVVVFVYDLRWFLILDKVTMPASAALFVFWLAGNWQGGGLLSDRDAWLGLLVAILVGVGFFAAQYYGSRGRWIGFGDVKLGLVMALALVQPSLVMGAIFLAYVIGASVGLGLMATGRKELSSKLPFGTFLSVATVVMLLWGEGIIDRYLKLIGY